MESTRSFFRIKSAYLMTCSAEKRSRSLYCGGAGHLSFAGGIFDAAYKRFLFRAMISPSRASLLPSPYAHAVSKKLQPESTESCKDSSDCWSPEPVQPLIPHKPEAMSLTSKPVRPSLRYFMRLVLEQSQIYEGCELDIVA